MHVSYSHEEQAQEGSVARKVTTRASRPHEYSSKPDEYRVMYSVVSKHESDLYDDPLSCIISFSIALHSGTDRA